VKNPLKRIFAFTNSSLYRYTKELRYFEATSDAGAYMQVMVQGFVRLPGGLNPATRNASITTAADTIKLFTPYGAITLVGGAAQLQCTSPAACTRLPLQSLKLKCDILVSQFAFKWVILYRYASARISASSRKCPTRFSWRDSHTRWGFTVQVESSLTIA
jgi:hypothetical protein